MIEAAPIAVYVDADACPVKAGVEWLDRIRYFEKSAF